MSEDQANPGPEDAPIDSDDISTARESRIMVRGKHGDDADRMLGALVGQYTIRRVIGSGGMGTVYEAMQKLPRRTVALKMMKQGIASRHALRRFEYEAQTLGRLRHENIAQIYEAGTYNEGPSPRPFFAMEYLVGAKPVTTYANDKNLSTRERLRLFAVICEAVQHGHQKGIIHRDLKPPNILVTSSGVPKIIDFGVARSTDSDLAVTTLQTDVGALIGTLQYMSPEQFAADPNDIDTRSDVYALGVILFELLCDSLPYDVTRVAIAEAARIVQQDEPTKPSTTDKRLRGDVETITLKALEKDRDRRYQSAVELEQDIERYLSGEPIAAKAPSAVDFLKRFARKHKTAAISITALFLVLVGAVIAVSIFASREATARTLVEDVNKDVVQLSNELEKSLGMMGVAMEESKRDLQRMNTVMEFQRQLLAWNPDYHGAMDKDDFARLMEQFLAVAIKRASTLFENQPESEAVIRQSIAKSYHQLKRFDEATQQLQRAVELYRQVLGDDDRLTLAAINDLGVSLINMGQPGRAEPLLREALAGRRHTLEEDDPEIAMSIHNLAGALMQQNQLAEAKDLFEEALQRRQSLLGPAHGNTLITMDNLAMIHDSLGNPDEAIALSRGSLELRRQAEDRNEIDTAQCLNNLAGFLQAKADLQRSEGDDAGARASFEEALVFSQEAFDIRQRRLPAGHHDITYSSNNLGSVLIELERYDEAEPYIRQAVVGFSQLAGPEHPVTLNFQINHGHVLEQLERYEETEALYQQALAGFQALEDGRNAMGAMRMLTRLYRKWDKPDKVAEYQAMLDHAEAAAP